MQGVVSDFLVFDIYFYLGENAFDASFDCDDY